MLLGINTNHFLIPFLDQCTSQLKWQGLIVPFKDIEGTVVGQTTVQTEKVDSLMYKLKDLNLDAQLPHGKLGMFNFSVNLVWEGTDSQMCHTVPSFCGGGKQRKGK